MGKVLHIIGIVAGYAACVIMIIVGAINRPPPGVDGWEFILFGVAAGICATIAVLDGAQVFPKIGLWKVGAKFSGLSDLATILIVLILGAAVVVVSVA
jgi:hypothetical protein